MKILCENLELRISHKLIRCKDLYKTLALALKTLFTNSEIMNTIYIIMKKLELRKKYKSGNAIEIIRDAILIGELSGEIAQNDFADALGISRSPVREALIVLEYHGLVEKLPNQHVRIITLDDEAIKDLFTDMSLLELEAIKNFSCERLTELSLITSQADFHRELYKNINTPLRKKFLEIITETYLVFVLKHSDGTKINPVFETLRLSLRKPSTLKSCYVTYFEVLADELIHIRTENKNAEEEESSC